ncbi:hypothetical protein [Listeria phage LMTA-57]|uniref:Uncharacterized protein n=3 Tax=Pecentumvirus TaxID=1857844 RepID=A0A060AGF0_9CAUD|nr:hypothetical protein HH39_gp061 [Listeria phage LMSP-25]YP_009616164.1 hypothetical protein FDI77_gp061 [Listeria phage LMTA-34]YP_009793481.1 hypothetical protein QLX42_gp170 [Listeria phage LMTA-57]AIA64404.1 hypothetical protein [Listeria phage LMSP-25]AID16962.1 hypothetical protein [Listeria phage LMTA-34]AID17632.1 hypothetical protein [Listeria phage LMTA-57]
MKFLEVISSKRKNSKLKEKEQKEVPYKNLKEYIVDAYEEQKKDKEAIKNMTTELERVTSKLGKSVGEKSALEVVLGEKERQLRELQRVAGQMKEKEKEIEVLKEDNARLRGEACVLAKREESARTNLEWTVKNEVYEENKRLYEELVAIIKEFVGNHKGNLAKKDLVAFLDNLSLKEDTK